MLSVPLSDCMCVTLCWSDCVSVCCSMHGGAGALMSIGLMERLPLGFMDRCMSELARSSGGDALISVCLWKAGYGFTDPGYSFYHWEAKSFDPGPENSVGLLSYLEAAVSNTADQYSLVSTATKYCYSVLLLSTATQFNAFFLSIWLSIGTRSCSSMYTHLLAGQCFVTRPTSLESFCSLASCVIRAEHVILAI